MREYRFDVVRVVCMTYLVAYFHLYGYVYTINQMDIVYSASTAMAHACLGLFTFVSGYLLPFISAMRELSLFVILVTANNRILTTLLLFYDEKGYTQFSNAVNLLIIIVVLIINFTVEKLTGASIEKGVGG